MVLKNNGLTVEKMNELERFADNWHLITVLKEQSPEMLCADCWLTLEKDVRFSKGVVATLSPNEEAGRRGIVRVASGYNPIYPVLLYLYFYGGSQVVSTYTISNRKKSYEKDVAEYLYRAGKISFNDMKDLIAEYDNNKSMDEIAFVRKIELGYNMTHEDAVKRIQEVRQVTKYRLRRVSPI